MRLEEVADPVAGPGEVVLRLGHAALNPADAYLAQKLYPANPELPHVLGRDGVGVVESVGEHVSDCKPGDKRIILRGPVGVDRWGTLAERVAVPAENLLAPPRDWTDEQAAGATLVYLTAYQALTDWGEPHAGSVVLITGASGGVGVASVQLASAMGLRVVALSRSKAKRQTLLELGADLAIDPTPATWPKTLRSQLEGKKVSIAIDNIGGEGFNQVLMTLGDNGRVSCVGRLAGPVPQFNTASIFFRRIRIGGISVGAYSNAEARRAWEDVTGLLARSGARPQVDQVFSLEQVPQAFERLAAGPMGKVLVRCQEHDA